MESNRNKYYIGLDCGTNSVGWAVTDEQYHLLRGRGKTMWGMRLFDEAKTAAERRSFRSTRRRLARTKRRIKLLQNLFSEEIVKVDPYFYIRLRESTYLLEDKHGFTDTDRKTKYILFNDPGYTDADFRRQYPTIWHLREDIIESVGDSTKHFDIRLYYLAIEHIIKHRGHFLRNGEINNGTDNFSELWNNLCSIASELGITIKTDYATEAKKLLGQKMSKTDKKKKLSQEMFGEIDTDQFAGDCKQIANMLCGSKISIDKLFGIESDKELKLELDKDNFEDKFPDISASLTSIDDAESLLISIKDIYDYIYLSDLLAGSNNISAAMVRNYDIHQQDLKALKQALKPFKSDYNHFFRTKVADGDKDCFYNAYINKGGIGHKDGEDRGAKSYSISQEDINKEIKRLLEKHNIRGNLMERAEEGNLLPKQRGYAKGTIPQQIHHNELKLILKKLVEDYPSFAIENPNENSNYNTKVKKIESIHSFRIPYYCGPMKPINQPDNEFSWQDHINHVVYPWNYTELVDLGEQANRFIERMKNDCTYIVDAKTLPKNSLIYQRYMVLNELNNLKINGSRIDNEIKQRIFTDAYLSGELNGNITLRKLSAWLKNAGLMEQNDELSGSADGKILPRLSTHYDFYRILGPEYNKQYPQDKLEKVIELIAILGNEPKMLSQKIHEQINCTDSEAAKLANLGYSDWGQFSLDFLNGIRADVNGRCMSVIEALWETPNNLMELLGGDFGFTDELNKLNNEKIDKINDEVTYDQVEELYCSPAVKRTVWQAIKIVNEIRKVMGYDPAKVFIEVTRGENKPENKGVGKTRRNQLLEKYKAIKNGKDEFANQLFEQLNSREDRDLQSKKLFLYFQQMGRCAYTGERIELDELINNTKHYDIDHIYPRSKTKDDSITHNLVLVKSEANREKTNIYPISESVRNSMRDRWSCWYRSGLISEEKYKRLTRANPLTPDELAGFISRQLVETGQSTKAIAELLSKGLPDTTRAITVKAGGVSDLRRYYGYNSNPVRPEFIKVRELNDLHHAKDAYLNIVVGNVINSTFTGNPYRWIKDHEDNYSIRTELLFRDSEVYTKKNGETSRYPAVRAWNYADSLDIVSNTMKRNDVVWTRMNHRLSSKGGGLMDAMLVRRADGYIPRKRNRRLQDTSKYGGYNSASGAYFMLIELSNGDRQIISVPLLNERNVKGYIGKQYPGARVIIPRIDFMSKMLVNGFPVHLSGRTGNSLLLYPAKQFLLPVDCLGYLKRVCSVVNKIQDNKDYIISDKDGLNDDNSKLFALITKRMEVFRGMPELGSSIDRIQESQEKFNALDITDQCKAIVEILKITECNAVQGNVSILLTGVKKLGQCRLSSKISGLDSIKLIHQSVTGLYEKVIDLKTIQPNEV